MLVFGSHILKFHFAVFFIAPWKVQEHHDGPRKESLALIGMPQPVTNNVVFAAGSRRNFVGLGGKNASVSN